MQESKKPFHVKLKIILPILLFSVSLIIIAAAILFFINERNDPESHNVDNPSSLTTESSPQQNIPISKRPITKFKSLTVTSKDFISKDIPAGNELTEAKKIIDNIKNDGFDSIELYLNHENGLLFSSDTYEAPYGDILKDIYTYCREKNITLITSLNIRALYDSNANFEKNQESIISVLGNKNLTSNTDMLVLRNNYISSDDITETEFKTLNLTISYEQHLKDELNTATKNYYEAVKKSNHA